MFDSEKALSYQRALAVFTRIVDEPASSRACCRTPLPRLLASPTSSTLRSCAIAPIGAISLSRPASAGSPAWSGMSAFGADRFSGPGRSIQTGAPVAVKDIANDPEFRYADVLREHNIVSVLNVPIFVDGTHWGVAEVDTLEKTTFA